ncbi:MAG: 3'-5' exonuclease, partial [Clostridiales bacterium]
SELSLLDMSRDDDFEDADWSGSWQEECRLLGCRIQKMRDEGYDYRDMAILLRSPRAKEAVLLEELQKMAIPAIAGQGGNSLESPEASLMVALLQIIDNPLQDIPMAAVLHSPIFDFSLDEMVKLRFDYPQKYLYRSLEAASKQSAESADIDNSHNKSDNKANSEDLFLLKVADFWQKLCRWRLESKKMKVSSFIWQLYQETGIYHLAGAMMKGEERQANLFSLYQRAIEYENSSFKGIFRFLRFLEDINAGGGKISPPRLLAENENVVRIMSIHRSKGLEFPVVFIAGLGGLFNFRDLQGDLIFDKDFGLGPKIVDLQKRIKFPSLAHEAIARKLRKQSIAEEIRILYVAMTRAKEKLILTASLKNLQKSAEKWALPFLAEDGDQEKISVNYLYKDRRPIDWLARTLLRHPDGKKLRLLAGLDESICLDDPSHWLIDICHPVSLVHKENPRQHQYLERVKDGFLLEETAYKKQMEEILSYQYPASKYCDFTAKWTVSQLQKTFAPPVFEESQELFPEEAEENTFSFQDKEKKQKSSSERGSVWHLFLQLLDLQRINSLEELRLQLVDLQAAGVMASFADEDLLRSVWRFWTSDLGQRAKKAAIIERERTFTYRLPGKFLIEEAQEDDFLIVQGMVDLAFYEDGAWVLLDYKTGGLSLSEAQILESYQNQLLLYKKALEDIWLAPVQEAYLYMLDDGRIIKMGQ